MSYLRQNTANQTILLGTFRDKTTNELLDSLTIANTDIRLWKGGALESSKALGGATAVADGRYTTILDASDTNTLGRLEVNVQMPNAHPVRREFFVLEAAAYDFMVGGTIKLAATQGDVTFGRVVISKDIAGTGALLVQNPNATGAGIRVEGQAHGLYVRAFGPSGIAAELRGVLTGLFNRATGVDGTALYNLAEGANSSGTVNQAIQYGMTNSGGNGPGSIGLLNSGAGIGQKNSAATGGVGMDNAATIPQRGVIDASSAIASVTGDLSGRVIGDSSTPFAGTGVQVDASGGGGGGATYDQILDLVRLLVRQDPAVASDLSAVLAELNANTGTGAGAYNPTTDSLEALHNQLSSSPIEINSSVDGSKIAVFAADTWKYSVPVSHPAMSLASSGVFAIKRFAAMSDGDSTLLVDTTTGLLIVNGAPQQDVMAGRLVVEDDSFSVDVESDVTATIQSGNYIWWLKVYDASGDAVTVAEGAYTVRHPGIHQSGAAR